MDVDQNTEWINDINNSIADIRDAISSLDELIDNYSITCSYKEIDEFLWLTGKAIYYHLN